MRNIARNCAVALCSGLTFVGAPSVLAQSDDIQARTDASLPQPEARPLEIDFSADPVLALAEAKADPATFRQIVVAALQQSPVEREALALEAAAKARLREAQRGILPTVDIGLSSFTTLDRNFSDDPENLLERARPRERTDLRAVAVQPLFQFGALQAGIDSAAARLRAAGFEREARAGEVAGTMIVNWTQVFGYQALERLVAGFVEGQDSLDAALEERIRQGVSATGDRARVASLRARGEVQLAQIRRELAGARARFEQLSGFAPPERLLRPPLLNPANITREYAIFAAENAPQVRSAEQLATAQDRDAGVAAARRFPDVSARLDAGRYGVFEEDRQDFDVRATLDVSWRLLGGGVWEQADAAQAEADAADAVADRIREEARRDAAIAWADVQAIEDEVAALEAAYRAARQSRDIVVTRFAALRGTLFDVADAENVYLGAAAAYIRALTELDQARYMLLLKTGRLLEALDYEIGEVQP